MYTIYSHKADFFREHINNDDVKRIDRTKLLKNIDKIKRVKTKHDSMGKGKNVLQFVKRGRKSK